MKRGLTYKVKIFSLCLLAFSLGFEYWDPLGVRSVFTVTKFAGILYALLSAFDLKRNFTISKHNKTFVYCGVFLWFSLVFISLIDTGKNGGELYLYLGVLQVVILYWLVFNDIIYNPKIRDHIFLALILGMLLISILLSLGIGIENIKGDQINDIDTTRVYFMGMNPNRMGDLAAVASLLVFSLVFSRGGNSKRYLLLFAIPALLSIIGYSGSRGSFLVFLLGMSFFFLLRKSNIVQKIIFIIIGVILGLIVLRFLEDFEVLQRRLTTTYERGDVGGRFEIWKSVFSIIQENPLFGVGTESYHTKMLQNYGLEKDSHNIFLFVWAVGGLMPLLSLLIFYTKTFRNALLSLRLNGDTTNIMIFAVVLFLVSKTGGVIESKMIWLMLSCIAPVYTGKLATKEVT